MAKCKYKGQFGKLVIGAADAAEEKEALEGSKDIFGKLVQDKHPHAEEAPKPRRRVVDEHPEDVVAEILEEVEERAAERGDEETELVVTVEGTPAEVAEAVLQEEEPEPEVHDSLSVSRIREEVRGECVPATIDRLMRAEFFRPDGARKSVLEILRSKEAGREDPRDEVLTALETKLAELTEA